MKILNSTLENTLKLEHILRDASVLLIPAFFLLFCFLTSTNTGWQASVHGSAVVPKYKWRITHPDAALLHALFVQISCTSFTCSHVYTHIHRFTSIFARAEIYEDRSHSHRHRLNTRSHRFQKSSCAFLFYYPLLNERSATNIHPFSTFSRLQLDR